MPTQIGNGLDLLNAEIINVADPGSATSAANKQYVDNVARGLKWKESVRVMATGNVDISTLNNGDSIDGVTVATGDRVLLPSQSTATQDGIYVVAASEGSTARSLDLATGVNATGIAVTVTEGTTNGDKAFIQTADPAVVGTDGLTFSQLGGGTTYTAGDALTESPAGTFNVAAGSGLEISSDTIRIAAAAAGDGLTGGAGSALAVGAGTGITVTANAVAIDTSVVNRKVAASVGNGSSTSYNVTHSLGTKDVLVQVRDNATDEYIITDTVATDTNTVTVTFATAPSTNAYRVIISG